MRIGKEIKRDTQLIILSVMILTITTLSFSYSAFFSVKSLSTIQEISTGSLDVSVTVDNTNSILNQDVELYPNTEAEISGGTGGNYSILTLLNNGSLDADFSVTISYDFDKLRELSGYSSLTNAELMQHLVPFSYLHIGIYDETNGSWINFSSGSSQILYPAISGLTATSGDANTYPILRDKVYSKSNSTTYQRRFKIYVWLSDETPTTEIGKFVYLKLNVKCAAGNETIKETVTSIS